MKRGLMIVGGAIGLLIVVFVGAMIYLASNLDSLVKDAVEKFGSEATLAEVKLNEVEISLATGATSFGGLKIGNPAGFKAPSAFEMGSISIKLDIDTIDQDPIVIKEIAIVGPRITYELSGTGSNIDAIQKNVDAYSKQFQSAGGDKKNGGEGPKLVIEDIYIRGGKIGVSAGFLEGKTLDAALPDIHLKDIGKEEKGADPSQIIQVITDSMTKGIGSAVGSLGLEDLAKSAAEGVAGAAKAVKEGVSSATEQLKEGGASVGGAIQEGVGEAGKAVKEGVSSATEQLQEGGESIGGAIQEGVGEAGKSLKKLLGD